MPRHASGELQRPGVHPQPSAGETEVPLASLRSITDPQDPLILNVIFPGGHRQYAAFFVNLAQAWRRRSAANVG